MDSHCVCSAQIHTHQGDFKDPIGEKVVVQGWVRSKRSFKDFSFVVVNDGSNMNGIQVGFR